MSTKTQRKTAIVVVTACVGAALGFALAGITAGRLAWAEWLARSGRPQAIEQAARLVPESARYQVLLARGVQASDPAAARAALERAVALNPRDARAWTQLGLIHEALGNPAAGQASLESAVSVSRRFQPRWTLTGLHFRNGNHEEFWRWAARAAAVAPIQADALYDLCWRLEPDPAALLERVVPDSAKGHRQFLAFLNARGYIDGLEPAALGLAAYGRARDHAFIRRTCEKLISQRRYGSALRLWNTLCTEELAACRPLNADRGPHLGNGDFRRAPSGTGFDWHVRSVKGLTSVADGRRAALRLRLSGKQPQEAALLFQIAPVTPGATYRLVTRYMTIGLPPDHGIRWRIVDVDGGIDLAAGAPLPVHERQAEQAVELSAAPAGGFVRVELVYERAPGTVRSSGQIVLSEVRLERNDS